MSTIRFAGLSDIGRVRTANEDRWFADPAQGLYLVADGIGGSAAGGLAAQIVAEVLPRLLRTKFRRPVSATLARRASEGRTLGAGLPTSPDTSTEGLPESGDLAVVPGAGSGDPRTAKPTPARNASEGPQLATPPPPSPPHSRVLPAALAYPANPETAKQVSAALAELSEQLRKESQAAPGLAGIGSTVVLTLLQAGHAIVSHLGDSRAYLLHAGQLRQLTKDHTIAQLLADRGDIRPDEVASHPSRSQLTRFVGMSTEAIPNTEYLELAPGDRLLLCSDGLSGMLSDQQLQAILNEQVPPDEACRRLVDTANEAGGTDNVTAVIVDIDNGADP